MGLSRIRPASYVKEVKPTTKTKGAINKKYPVNKAKLFQKRAVKKGMAFEFTEEQFNTLLKSNCVYCGDVANSVDRIDSSKGYTIANSQPCCPKCNFMKHLVHTDSFIEQVKKIAIHLKLVP